MKLRSIVVTVAAALLLAVGIAIPAAEQLRAQRRPDPPYVPSRIVSESPAAPYPNAVKVELSAQDRAYNAQGEEDKAKLKTWRRALTPEERKRIESAIAWQVIEWNDDAPAACCVPHHRLTYFDAGGHEIGRIDICFCCACIGATPALPNPQGAELRFKYREMEAIVAGLGIPTDIDCSP